MSDISFINATVVKQTGNMYKLCLLPKWEPFTAVLRGKIRLKGDTLTNPLTVGDHVDGYFQGAVKDPSQEAVITAIHPRRNYLIRKSTNLSRQAHIIAANIDTAYLVLSATEPQTPLAFIDRLLVTCQAYRVPAVLLLNKCDELIEIPAYREQADHLASIYRQAGYSVQKVSAKTGMGLDALRNSMKDKVSLFSGVSGVGKTSLVNALDPDLALKTAPISMAHLMGKHTTTFYQMHPLSQGGYIIDSPGIRGFGLLEMNREEIYHYFPEIFAAATNCKYNPCSHIHEPHCAVKEAVENGDISIERYQSYLKLMEDPDGSKYRS